MEEGGGREGGRESFSKRKKEETDERKDDDRKMESVDGGEGKGRRREHKEIKVGEVGEGRK